MTGYASLIIAAGVAGVLAVVYLLGRAIIEKIVLAGKSEERANQAEADLSITKKQGEIMRNIQEVIKEIEKKRRENAPMGELSARTKRAMRRIIAADEILDEREGETYEDDDHQRAVA